MSLDYSAYMQGGLLKGWNLHCAPSSVGMFNCTLVIPSLESEGCNLPYKTVGSNSLDMTISFPNGKSKQITKHLSAPFQDILIIPVYHCGDGTCETSLGETPANCCYDCACKDSTSYGKTYYCDFDPDTHLGGCLPKANITLVIDSPTAPVYFSTCEMTNTVNIKAHIENQPKNAKPGHEYATLNGSAAEMLHCDEEQSLEGVYDGGGNYTFNCTLMVPRLSQCSEGRTYTYEPNSLSMLISYKNGNQKTEAQTLTASLPTITTRQGIRTMYDITQEGIRKMKASLQKTMDITREMLDAFKSCMETVKAIAYMTMIAAVVGGIYSGATAHTDTTSGDIKQGVSTATSIGKAGTKIMEAYSKMCEYLQTQYRMDLEVQKIETEMVKMEMCMEQNQHMLDVGQCDKNPQNCFTQMTSCVDFDDIDKYSKNLGRIISDGSNALGDMSDAIEEAADALEGIGGGTGGTALLSVECNSGGTGISSCCRAKGIKGTSTANTGKPSCENSKLTINLITIENCKYPVVYNADNLGYPLCRGSSSCNRYSSEVALSPNEDKDLIFKLYCFDSEKDFTDNLVNIQKVKISSVKDFPLTLQKYNDKTCTCTGTSTSGAGNSGNSQSTTPATIVCGLNSGEEIVLSGTDKLSLVSELSGSATLICEMPQSTKAKYIETKSYQGENYIKITVTDSSDSSCKGKTGWTIGGEGTGCYWTKNVAFTIVSNSEKYDESYKNLQCKALILCVPVGSSQFTCSVGNYNGVKIMNDYNSDLGSAFDEYCKYGSYAGLQCINDNGVRTFSCWTKT